MPPHTKQQKPSERIEELAKLKAYDYQIEEVVVAIIQYLDELHTQSHE